MRAIVPIGNEWKFDWNIGDVVTVTYHRNDNRPKETGLVVAFTPGNDPQTEDWKDGILLSTKTDHNGRYVTEWDLWVPYEDADKITVTDNQMDEMDNQMDIGSHRVPRCADMTSHQNQCDEQFARIGAPAPLQVLAFLEGSSLANPSSKAMKRIRQGVKMLTKEGYKVDLDESTPVRLVASKERERIEILFPEFYPFKSPIWRVGESDWFIMPANVYSPATMLPQILSSTEAVTIVDAAREREAYRRSEQEAVVEREASFTSAVHTAMNQVSSPLKHDLDECKRKLELQEKVVEGYHADLEACQKEVEDLKEILRAMGLM